MKDIIVCVVILTAMCSLFIFNLSVAEKSSDVLCDKIDETCADISKGDEALAKKSFDDAKGEWEKCFKKMKYLYNHALTEEIDSAYFRANYFFEGKDYEKVHLNLSEAKHLIKDLGEHEKITLDNIF